MLAKKSLLLLPLLLSACISAPADPDAPPADSPSNSKASFNSPLFARSPEVVYKNGQYFAAIYPRENWTVIVAAVDVEFDSGRTLVYVSKLTQGPPTQSPQLFPLDLPGSVTPEFLQQALYWREPDGWNHPLTVRAVK